MHPTRARSPCAILVFSLHFTAGAQGLSDAPLHRHSRMADYFEFGDWVLDMKEGRLFRHGRKGLEPRKAIRQDLRVLRCLVEHPNEQVTKEALVANAWDGKFIGDSTISASVSRLRNRVLKEDRGYIKTEHGKGFRFVEGVRAYPEKPSCLATYDSDGRGGSLGAEPSIRAEAGLEPADVFVGRERLFQLVSDFVGRAEPGYLVLVGGMGRGKTRFLKELLMRRRAAGETPIAHFIDHNNLETRQPDGIAACIAAQLQRKFGLPPSPPAAERGLPQVRLRALLAAVGERVREAGTTELICIDAADQAETNPTPLVPNLLGTLPLGVQCIVTSRSRADQVADAVGVRVESLDEWVDDREDVRVFLARAANELELSDRFVDQIVGHDTPPVFFTIVARARTLGDPGADPERAQALRTTSGLWVTAPEGLVREEWDRVMREGKRRGKRRGEREEVARRNIREGLGLLALAGEAVTENQLSELGLWESEGGVTEHVLRLAANFFRWRPPSAGPDEPYRFDHPGHQRHVLAQLNDAARRRLQGRLSAGCRALLAAGARSASWEYALRHLLRHVIGAEDWDSLGSALADLPSMTRRGALFGFAGVFRDVEAAARHPRISPAWQQTVASLAAFLGERIWLFEALPGCYAQEILNEFLPTAGIEMNRRMVMAGGGTAGSPLLAKVSGPPAHSRSHHWSQVGSVAFSADGRFLASGGWDGHVRLWDGATGTPRAIGAGSGQFVNQVAFSPDNRLVVALDAVDPVRLLDAETGALIALVQHPGASCAAFSPDCRRLATGGGDTVRLWDIPSGDPVAVLAGHSGSVNSVSFAPDGGFLVSGSDDETVRMWNASDGASAAMMRGHRGRVTSVAISSDSQRIASAGGFISRQRSRSGNVIETAGDYRVRVWDRHGTLLASAAGHSKTVSLVTFLPGTDRIVSAGDDGTVRIWEASTGAQVAIAEGHRGPVQSLSCSSDGRSIVSGGRDGSVRVWNAATGALSMLLEGEFDDLFGVKSVAFSPCGQRIAAAGFPAVWIWDVTTGKPVTTPPRTFDRVEAACSPDGRWLAVGRHDGMIRVSSVADESERLAVQTHTERVSSVAFSRDGRWVISASNEGVRVMDAATGALSDALGLGHVRDASDVCFAPDGRSFAVAADNGITLFPLDSAEPVVFADSDMWRVGFSPNGELLAGNDCRDVDVWDVASATRLLHLEHCDDDLIQSFAFSADARLIAGGRRAGSISVFETAGGEHVRTVSGHSKLVVSMTGTTDARWSVSGSLDGTVRLWSGFFERCVNALLFDLPVRHVALVERPSPRLIVVTFDGRAFTYDLRE
jgi:WD40 repeat protein/DNA-binding winged helix-turn-helix (wHTH) protein